MKTSSSLSQKEVNEAVQAVVSVVPPSVQKQIDKDSIGDEDRKKLNLVNVFSTSFQKQIDNDSIGDEDRKKLNLGCALSSTGHTPHHIHHKSYCSFISPTFIVFRVECLTVQHSHAALFVESGCIMIRYRYGAY